MRNLFLCDTPYQVIVATQIAQTKFNNDFNGIVITDKIAEYSSLYNSIKESNSFDEVIMWKIKADYKKRGKVYYIFSALLSKIHLHKKDKRFGSYDNVFCGNLGSESTILLRHLKRKKFVKTFLFEDGFSTYSNDCGNFFEVINNKAGLKNKFLRLFRWCRFEYFLIIKGIYVFSPKLFDWKPEFDVYEIEKIDSKNSAMIELYNRIFGMEKLDDSYKEKVIFFEESYYADSINVKDDVVIEKIASIVNQEDFLLKMHPRNPTNRFKSLGIHVNRNTSIPWEIIALNINLEDKTLVTIASGSALTSLVNTNMKPKRIIMLMDCDETDKEGLTPSVDILRRIGKSFGDIVWLPKSVEEVYEYFEKEQKSKRGEK